jgi:hypothetical protein
MSVIEVGGKLNPFQKVVQQQDEHEPLHMLTSVESAMYPHCHLKASQLAKNVAAPAGVAAAFSLTGGHGLVVTLFSCFVPVPVNWLQPVLTKVRFSMGLMHVKNNANENILVQRARGLAPETHSLAFLDKNSPLRDGTYVWVLLGWKRINTLRATVYGPGSTDSGQSKCCSQVRGMYSSTLQLQARDGKNVVVLVQTSVPPEFANVTNPIIQQQKMTALETIVDPRDGVQYVMCGQRPMMSKYHITVRGGQVTAVQLKNELEPERGTKIAGVAGATAWNPFAGSDAASNLRREAIFSVADDGASGKDSRGNTVQSHYKGRLLKGMSNFLQRVVS